MTTWDPLLEVAREAVDLAAAIVLERRTGRVQAKGDRDYVTEVDLTVERTVRGFLGQRTPHIGFLGEEEGGRSAKGLTWILDPVDGTSNLAREIPLCGISLGLADGDDPVLGVIDLPFLRERYAAAPGTKATLNGKKIETRRPTDLADAVVAIGDYAVGPGAAERNRTRVAFTELLAATVERVRMFGTAAIDLAWLAAGRTDAAVTMSNKPWDMAAGVAIAREAGALVVDADGSHYTLRSTATVAVAPALAPAILDLLRRVDTERS
ncbi:inositol monophosphatase family protein [Frankia nepalensis]|uniref:Inositol-1-monophosphatase n=1 Tax=Frankia nepalensis TaxID=1836974 RepID=A0A937USV4_9ACTN|nr:inositol monophosphatase family protein [Frankia nepalensis]MBL7632912.1 inositol monophosphatase [Frankia nepalensis]